MTTTDFEAELDTEARAIELIRENWKDQELEADDLCTCGKPATFKMSDATVCSTTCALEVADSWIESASSRDDRRNAIGIYDDLEKIIGRAEDGRVYWVPVYQTGEVFECGFVRVIAPSEVMAKDMAVDAANDDFGQNVGFTRRVEGESWSRWDFDPDGEVSTEAPEAEPEPRKPLDELRAAVQHLFDSHQANWFSEAIQREVYTDVLNLIDRLRAGESLEEAEPNDEPVGECASCHKLVYSDWARNKCENCGQPLVIVEAG